VLIPDLVSREGLFPNVAREVDRTLVTVRAKNNKAISGFLLLDMDAHENDLYCMYLMWKVFIS
jgi:hypothetical protein